jgi:RsiW-degrading membrane proteinase PrsW (M82 family)
MAAITTAVALAGLLLVVRRADDWRSAALAFAIALPLQPLAFYLVRMPIDGLLRASFGAAGWLTVVSLFYAPLTEEPAKWLTTAVPGVRRAIHRHPIPLALAVGIGFGIGEIWFLAYALTRSPQYPDLPFWMFSGFLIERSAVCFLHGAFITPLFYALARGRPFWLGGSVGIVLHFLLNFPIYLAQTGAFGIGPANWQLIMVSWIFWSVFGCVALVVILASRFARLGSHTPAGQSGMTPP